MTSWTPIQIAIYVLVPGLTAWLYVAVLRGLVQ